MSQRSKIQLDAPQCGELVEWNEQKRYGFLDAGGVRIFLHIRDFAEHHKRPAIGDRISFILGQDTQGRICATKAAHVNDGGRITGASLFLLGTLLVLPVLALLRWRADWRWAGGVGLVMTALTYMAYARDKQSARAKTHRHPEFDLHLLALAGGWPGAFLAQRRLRHKCSKRSFQTRFWLIVLLYQCVAFDSLQDWKWTRLAWAGMRRSDEPPPRMRVEKSRTQGHSAVDLRRIRVASSAFAVSIPPHL